jgi:hypothetical protein
MKTLLDSYDYNLHKRLSPREAINFLTCLENGEDASWTQAFSLEKHYSLLLFKKGKSTAFKLK